MKYITYLLFLLPLSANCQFKNYAKENTVWHDGFLHHEDGTVYKGKLNYNFISDILKCKFNDGEEHIFTANSVLYFQFVVGSDTIKYFSLPYDSKGVGHERLSFYKVEYERRHDIIVSKNMMEIKEQSFSDYKGPSQNNMTYTPQKDETFMFSWENVERVIFINSKGKMHPVLKGKVDKDLNFYYSSFGAPDKKIEKQVSEFNMADTLELSSNKEVEKFKLIDKKFIPNIYPDYNSELSKFIKSKKLKFKSIGDLITVIDKKYQLEKFANRN